jgi:hypothetical protein
LNGANPSHEAADRAPEREAAAAPRHAYRGRRIYQGVIAVIGSVILSLAIADLNRVDRSGSAMNPETPKIARDLSNFLDQEVGHLPVDIAMLVLGGWIVFFGLHGVLLKGPQLAFDKHGIRYFRFGRQTIPWEAIQQIHYVERRRTSLLRAQALDLELKDPAPYAGRQPWPYRIFRRSVHMFDPKLFTIHGYDIEMPMIAVAKQMQAIVEPESASGEAS